jgi:hypothetical protein
MDNNKFICSIEFCFIIRILLCISLWTLTIVMIHVYSKHGITIVMIHVYSKHGITIVMIHVYSKHGICLFLWGQCYVIVLVNV